MPIVTISLSLLETEKLLRLLGHQPADLEKPELTDLLGGLYRAWASLEDEPDSVDRGLEVTPGQLLLIHNAFTPEAFGLWSREFRSKLAHAFVELDRLTFLPDIRAAVDQGQDFGDAERLRLTRWRHLEAGDPQIGLIGPDLSPESVSAALHGYREDP